MRRFTLSLAVLLAVCATSACRSTAPREVPVLSTARVAPDFETYVLRRVGLLPVTGQVDTGAAQMVQEELFAALSRSTPYEIVVLDPADLEEVRANDPLRSGAHRPATLIELSRRFRLDGLVFAQVTHRRTFQPLALSLHAELVTSETGQVLWASSVHLDATDERVRLGLQGFYAREHRSEDGGAGWELALLSPLRFARFAAHQIALQL
jgi:hypothetical protein